MSWTSHHDPWRMKSSHHLGSGLARKHFLGYPGISSGCTALQHCSLTKVVPSPHHFLHRPLLCFILHGAQTLLHGKNYFSGELLLGRKVRAFPWITLAFFNWLDLLAVAISTLFLPFFLPSLAWVSYRNAWSNKRPVTQTTVLWFLMRLGEAGLGVGVLITLDRDSEME